MKVLIAPDSFKECLDAAEVARALADGVQTAAAGQADVVCRPLADGGEGIADVMLRAAGGEKIFHAVTGPLGAPVQAALALLADGNTAVVELAQAAGLHLVPPARRNPGITTTRGVGELILHALDRGATRIIVGLGGSATNDGGAGLAQALGARLADASGQELPPGGAALRLLAHLDVSGLDPRLARADVMAACDVTNPLCGPNGASAVYGPQKGAAPEQAAELDRALHHYADIIQREMGIELHDRPGAGAAGGAAAGLMAFAQATLHSGVDLVMDACGDMNDLIQWADLVITGEGAVDGQSAQGKVVHGLAQRAKRFNTPLVVVAGQVRGNLDALHDAGATAVFSLTPGLCSLEEAMANAPALLRRTAENIMRLWSSAR